MNQVVMSPLAPSSRGLDLSTSNMAVRMRYAGTLDIAFQPIVDIHTGRVLGFEALTRNVQSLGFSSPTEFFDRCHDDGQLLAVEEYLLTQAFDKFARIEGHKTLKLFINLDGRNIMAGPKLGLVIATLRDRYELTNANLALEVSERHELSESEGGIPALLNLRAQFGSLTLDDFGSGHANLQLFYHVEPSILKLDRFIISSIGSDPKKSVFLQHIVRMAHLLGSLVVAEGVETTQEYYVCRELGCDLVQDYAVARPTTSLAELELSYAGIAALRNQDRRKTESDISMIVGLLDTTSAFCFQHALGAPESSEEVIEPRGQEPPAVRRPELCLVFLTRDNLNLEWTKEYRHDRRLPSERRRCMAATVGCVGAWRSSRNDESVE